MSKQAIDRWNATIALVRDLSLDPRLTGLASGIAEQAAAQLEKISQQGIAPPDCFRHSGTVAG